MFLSGKERNGVVRTFVNVFLGFYAEGEHPSIGFSKIRDSSDRHFRGGKVRYFAFQRQRKERSQEDAGILLALEGCGGTGVPM